MAPALPAALEGIDMTTHYEQGETIKYQLDGRMPDGSLATVADLVGITAAGQLQKTRAGGSLQPEQGADTYEFSVIAVDETAETGAGWVLVLAASTTLTIPPGTYVFEKTVTFSDDTKVKEQDLVEIRESIQ